VDARQFSVDLEAIKSDDDFAWQSQEVVDRWQAAAAGIAAVEPILRFMEANPDIEYGVPGPLVHFVERFYRQGYEQLLADSLARRPTSHTVWMLNRLINGAQDEATRRQYVQLMKRAAVHPQADASAVEQARDFLAD
jgi:hypothetical protein